MRNSTSKCLEEPWAHVKMVEEILGSRALRWRCLQLLSRAGPHSAGSCEVLARLGSPRRQVRCFQGRGLARACSTPERTRKHPAAGDRSVWDSSVGLLKPKVKVTVRRRHWFQNADACTHAHGIQVMRPGYRGAGGRFTVVGMGGWCVWERKWPAGTWNTNNLSLMPATISFLQYKFTSMSCG